MSNTVKVSNIEKKKKRNSVYVDVHVVLTAASTVLRHKEISKKKREALFSSENILLVHCSPFLVECTCRSKTRVCNGNGNVGFTQGDIVLQVNSHVPTNYRV